MAEPLPFGGTGSDGDMAAKVMQECEDLWLDINKLQAQAASCSPTRVIADGEDSDIADTMSEVKLKALKGQLSAEAGKEHSILPTDPVTLRALLLEEIETSVKQLEQTLEVVQGQRRELEEEVKWEKQIMEQQKQIQDTLQRKMTMAQEASEQPSNSAERELLVTKSRIKKETIRILSELKDFSKKHFPHPDQLELELSDSPDTVKSLLDVIETLMNQCVMRGSSPYVELDDTYWPPYIELLLRCGIAQRHEQNANLVRLTPFHMK